VWLRVAACGGDRHYMAGIARTSAHVIQFLFRFAREF